MATMRAKLRVAGVQTFKDDANNTTLENVQFTAVSRKFPYGEDGADEDNTYAKFTPTANLQMSIANPALFNVLKEGDVYYVDFTAVPAPVVDAEKPAPVEEPTATE